MKKLFFIIFFLSFVSAFAQTPLPPRQGGLGVSNSNLNTLTFSGAYGLTLTLSGTTNVTLPTSGTLLTSATAVTSVALTMPSIFSVSGSPVTTTGTLAVTLASQNQNLILASPNGSSGTPSFRALTSNDIPSLTAFYEVPLTFSTGLTRTVNTITVNSTQSISKLSNLTTNGFVKTGSGDGTLSIDNTSYLSGTVAIANGGTGQTTANDALNAFLPSQTGNVNKILQTDGSNTLWADAGSGSGTVTTVSVVTANGLSGTVANATTTPAITLDISGLALTKLASIADQRILGNVSGSSAPAIALTNTQTKTFLAIANTDVSGLGTASTHASSDYFLVANNLSEGTAATIRSNISAAQSGANTDITSILLNQTGLVVKGGDANALTIKPNETLTGARTLNLKVNDVSRTIDLSGSLTVSSAATISGTNTGDQTITLTSDVTGTGTGSFATTIANSAVTLAKMANMATSSLIYRKTAGSGAPEVNTLATLKTDLLLTGTNSGDVTLAGENYLSLSSQVITANAVNLSNTNVTGTLAAARFGALTGDVTNSAGSYATIVGKVNGVSYGTSPSTNTVPVVTSSNTITYETVPNAALANSAITIQGSSVALGGSALSTTSTPQFSTIGLGVAADAAIPFLSAQTSATTNALVTQFQSSLSSSGTVAANFGQKYLYRLDDNTTANQNAGAQIFEWNIALHATHASQYRLQLSTGGAAIADVLTITGAGNGTFAGTLGASNLSGTNSGDVTIAGENYLSLSSQVLTANAVALSGSNVTGTLPMNKGGTAVTTLALNAVLYGNAATNILALAVNSSATNKFLTQSSSNAPAWSTLVSGDIPDNAANTTGSAAKWTTARNLAGNSTDGSANVTFSNKFIVQGTTDAGLSAAQFLGSLATGILKNTTSTGVLSIAVNSDLPVMTATVSGAVPTPPNDATKYLDGTGAFSTPAGGAGLSNIVETLNSSAPNGTIKVEELKVSGASTSTHNDLSLVPKGNGSFLLATPDNTSTGGNKRGVKSVDLQLARTSAANVASGTYSFIGGGDDNIASGVNSVAFGDVSSATGDYSFSGGGTSNTASGNQSFIAAGANNTASGASSFVAGAVNSASATTSTALGNRSKADKYGQIAFASSDFSANGDAQASFFVVFKQTTNATANIELTMNAVNDPGNQHVTLSNNTCWTFEVLVIGKQSGSTNYASYTITGSVVRGANAASTTVNGVITTTIQDGIGVAAVSSVIADVTNGGIEVVVTGKAATTINWVAKISTVEVTL